MRILSLFKGSRCTLMYGMVVMSLVGCVRVEAEKEAPKATRLIIAKDRNGVQMQFKSEEGLHYSIIYRDQGVPNDKWKQLPQAVEIPGTGDLILITDPSPRAKYREYRINSLISVRRKDLK